jgi:hypothetical protein
MAILAQKIQGSEAAVIQGGMVPTVDQMPEDFAGVVMDFPDRSWE